MMLKYIGSDYDVTWRHQATTETNIELSVIKFCGIHMRAI